MSLALRIEAISAVRTIAEGLTFSHAATAQGNYRPAAQTIRVAFRIVDGEFTLDPNGPVVNYGDFRGHAPRS